MTDIFLIKYALPMLTMAQLQQQITNMYQYNKKSHEVGTIRNLMRFISLYFNLAANFSNISFVIACKSYWALKPHSS